MATEITLKVNPNSLQSFQYALNEFRMATGISMRDSFIREAGFCCMEFMRYSPPMPKSGGQGLTGAAKRAGEGATEGDIRSIFTTNKDPSAAFAMMVAAVRSGDRGQFTLNHALARSTQGTAEGQGRGRRARGIFSDILADDNMARAFGKFRNRFEHSKVKIPVPTSDIRGVHQSIKSRYNGTILANGGPGLSQKYLVDAAALKGFLKLKLRHVGYLKAGWASTLLSLPTPVKTEGVQYASRSKVPAWILRNNSGGAGYANFLGDQKSGNFNLTIGNRFGDNDGAATKAKTIAYVLQVRASKLDKEVMRRLGKYIKAFNAQN